jgi:hypothetical protein
VATLFRKLLGDTFDKLPPVLRRFHDDETGGTACLEFQVSHGKGRLSRGLAKIARLPKPSDSSRGRMKVMVEGRCERWVREINGRRFETRQWRADNLLIEETGLLRLGFEVIADAAGLRFHSVRGWLAKLPLPPPLLPRVTAIIIGREASWWVTVRVELPLLGLLMQYEGEATPE